MPGVEIDRVAFYSADADTAWRESGPTDAEPEVAPFMEQSEGMTVRPDGPYALALTWVTPTRLGPVDHYSIYASSVASPSASNETLVGSTRGAKRFRDTGLRPASHMYYLVVGYDIRGREVIAYRGAGKSAVLETTYSLRLTAADARLDPALERVQDEDRVFVRVSKDADAGGRTASVRYPLVAPCEPTALAGASRGLRSAHRVRSLPVGCARSGRLRGVDL